MTWTETSGSDVNEGKTAAMLAEEKGYADLARELVWTKAELLRGEIARNLDQGGALATLEKKLAELEAIEAA